MAERELATRRTAVRDCLCDSLRKDGTCKSCGCKNIRITLPDITAEKMIAELGYMVELDRRGDVSNG